MLDGTNDVDTLLAQGNTMIKDNNNILNELIQILVEENKDNLQ